MSGIAKVAHDQGMEVTGSDIKDSRYTKQLREAGITIFIGQKAENHPCGQPHHRRVHGHSRKQPRAHRGKAPRP